MTDLIADLCCPLNRLGYLYDGRTDAGIGLAGCSSTTFKDVEMTD